MFEALAVTLFPVAFLAALFVSGERFRRRQIDMDGAAPVRKAVFYGSKYLIVVVWAAMILGSWGVRIAFFNVPAPLKKTAFYIWISGFTLLFIGRFTLGSSFRIGQPNERTTLRVHGLFRVSRNPMYLAVYLTLLASVMYTLNPVLLFFSALIVGVHHKIVLAEEIYLRSVFGEEYGKYCRDVRRYL